MVEVKYNKKIIMCFIVFINALSCFLFIHSFFVAKNHWSQPLYSILVYTIFFLITPLTTIILYNIAKYYRIIFNDNEITIKNKIVIGSMLFHDKVNMYSWEKVSALSCLFGTLWVEFDVIVLNILNPLLHRGFAANPNEQLTIKLNFLKTNKKDAIEYMLTKLPDNKVPQNVKTMLIRKYGIL